MLTIIESLGWLIPSATVPLQLYGGSEITGSPIGVYCEAVRNKWGEMVRERLGIVIGI